MSELDELLGEKKKENLDAPLDDKKSTEDKTKDEIVLKKEEQLANLNKAIDEANIQLRTKRKEAKTSNDGEEEEIPKIDMEDPGSKAWNKHINSKVEPLAKELEQEKEEVRTYALREFLKDKPALAANPEKLKSLLGTYQTLSDGKISGKTSEGVLIYLDKAYAAENYEELSNRNRERRYNNAKADEMFSEPAISRGGTRYNTEREPTPHLSEEDRVIIAKWGMTPEEWIDLKKKQSNKS